MNVLVFLRWCFWVVSAVVVLFVALLVAIGPLFKNQEYNIDYLFFSAAIIRVLANLFFNNTIVLYSSAAAIPVVSFALRPELPVAAVAFVSAVLIGFLSFSLDTIRSKI